ncbi:hypothetical protein [Sinorhizobium medicae]
MNKMMTSAAFGAHDAAAFPFAAIRGAPFAMAEPHRITNTEIDAIWEIESLEWP